MNKQFELFNILGNAIRFEIVDYLSTGEKCVCNIFKRLNLSQNLVSHHLGILRKSGLIKDRKEGRWVYYSLDEKALKVMEKALTDILEKEKENPGR